MEYKQHHQQRYHCYYHYFVLSFFVLVPCSPVKGQEAYTLDKTIRYYTDTSLICDHPQLNVSTRTDIRSLSWIFPDGTAVDASTPLNPRYFRLSDSENNVPAYKLTLFRVEDDMFGHYTCIIIYKDKAQPLSVIRMGVNVDGADFRELIEKFEENAMIGGVAAGALLVVLGSSCILWHFRYSNRKKMNKIEMEDHVEDIQDTTAVKKSHVYNNRAYNEDKEDMDEELQAVRIERAARR